MKHTVGKKIQKMGDIFKLSNMSHKNRKKTKLF